MTNYRTPDINSIKLLDCCKMLSKSSAPILLRNTPVDNADYHMCGKNVENHIKRYGGKLEYGWIVWQLQELYFDAEAHAIWIDEDENRCDITPHEEETEYIVYLPNHDYLGQIANQYNEYPPNYLYPCTESEEITDFVKIVNMANYKYFQKKGNASFKIEEAIVNVFSADFLTLYNEIKERLFPQLPDSN